MKRKASISVLAIVMLLLVNTRTSQSLSPAPSHQPPNTAGQKVLLEYEWYNDLDYTDPTGATGTVSSELSRLRNLYSSYVFSASPSMGLVPFEYGYTPVYVTAVIYSNYY